MKCLSEQEVSEWVAKRLPLNTPPDVAGLPDLRAVGYESTKFPLPSDSGRKVCLARLAGESFKGETSVLVWVRNWVVFPSSGHLPLLVRFRQALGEHRPVEDCPGHLFSAQEAEDALSVIILALEFFWDCYVLGASGRTAFFVSHDEYAELLSVDRSVIAQFNAALDAAS